MKAVDSSIEAAMEAQRRQSDDLLDRPGIVGVATGMNKAGKPRIVIYTVSAEAAQQANFPDHVEGIPTTPVITGMFVAGSNPTTRQRPAPVGFSVGHPDITAGTIGARVEDGSGTVYILSNNHVLANTNDASIGDSALQPGPSDGGTDPDDKIGELADYEPIDFSNPNTMDAAIASSSTANLDFATPTDDAYGAPGTTPTSASLGLAVQKYGRTTGHTTGTVSELNVTVDVCYEPAGPFNCKSSARFENQIAITSNNGSFSDGGDSGSLIVTNDANKNPVGLLFAGSDSRTLANPIGPVLDRFGVSIDDGSDDGGTNSAPTASFTSSCTDLSCTFDGSGSSDSDGSIASYDWDFGDGATGTGQTVSHTYGSEGTYTVTLTVTDDSGATDSQTQDVSVSASTAALSIDGITPNSVAAGSSVDVEIAGSGFESGAEVALENGQGPTPSVSNVGVVDANTITATISASSGGPPRNRVWDVRVTNPDGASVVLTDGFTVTP